MARLTAHGDAIRLKRNGDRGPHFQRRAEAMSERMFRIFGTVIIALPAVVTLTWLWLLVRIAEGGAPSLFLVERLASERHAGAHRISIRILGLGSPRSSRISEAHCIDLLPELRDLG
jgi:hypothetical protein